MENTPTPTTAQFLMDMREAGFRVNWLTFLDGTTHPTVYGSPLAVRPKTVVPLAWKPMGNSWVIYPIGPVKMSDLRKAAL